MPYFHGHFSNQDLQTTLEGLGKSVFFVQVGAMDGLTYDPIHPFVNRLGWKGLLMEPVPYLHERLKKNYEGETGLTFVQAALADFDGQIEMTVIKEEAEQAQVFVEAAFGLSTIMPDKGLIAGKGNPEHIKQLFKTYAQKMEVPCLTLETLFERYNVTALDLMVIDTEGADWMVARQLSLKKYAPRIVYLEYNHLSAYEQTACAEHFKNYGYRIYLDEKDENFMAVKA